MRSLSFLHLLLFLLATLICKCSQAQDYVVTLANDTLRGKIKSTNIAPDRRVTVTDATKKKTSFTILKVRAYTYDGQVYHPAKTSTGYVFMKLIKSGYLSLYGFQVENQSTYDGRFLIKKDGRSLDVPNLGFKKNMTKFLGDCMETTAQIEKGILKKDDLEKIVDSYNDCIDRYTRMQLASEQGTLSAPNAIETWTALEEKVKSLLPFDEKENAIEMIREIKNKIDRTEKVPNFLLDGLKSALSKTDLVPELENARKTL